MNLQAATRHGWRCGGMLGAIVLLLGSAAWAGQLDPIFANGFEEGELPPGAQISGVLLSDPNYDGNLSDGSPIPGATIYLDQNYNGQLDEGELTRVTAADGSYLFAGLDTGLKHVRQTLPAPNVQTVPPIGAVPALDGWPDEVVDYTHAAPGVGDFDVPYGKKASDWPAEWSERDNGPLPEPVDAVELVLQPLGVRTRAIGNTVTRGAEALSLPTGTVLTVRFDEPIIDGPGFDLQLYTIPTGSLDEQAELLVGGSLDQLQSLGLVSFADGVNTLPVDLAGSGVIGPVRYVRLIGQDNGGTWAGFEITALQAINVAVPDPSAHIVEVTALDQVFTDRDFGRYYQDLPPTLTLGLTDLVPTTAGLRAGEAVQLQLFTADDLGISARSLQANGQALSIAADGTAQFVPANAGELLVQATAIDTAGQMSTAESLYYVLAADGTDPFNPNASGQSQGSAGAPRARILSPAPGESFSADVPIIGSITGMPPASDWQLEFAAVDLVDPYNLAAPDPDYQPLASGTGNRSSAVLGTLPLSALPDGIYFLRLTAQNAGGQRSWFGQVIARNVAPELLRPQIDIEAPGDGSSVSLTIDVLGSIQSTRPLRDWYVEYAPAASVDLNDLGSNAPPWRRIAEGSSTLGSGSLLANFDGTRLRNDRYVLRVVARNDIGLGWVEPLLLDVVGEAKFGRNRLEFVDIDIELGGFPLRFVRVYDSLESDRIGDLGFGWNLQLQSTDVGETVPDTGVLGLFGSTPFRVGTRVYLTAPSGERLGFSFDPEAAGGGGFGTPYRVRFIADPGNYHRLEVPQGDLAFLTLREDGSAYLLGAPFPWNPERYVLIAPDGKRYTIDQDAGLLKAEDPAGRSLSFNPNGVQHSAGPRLLFARDGAGRITQVTDPDGNQWSYTYDAAGDLAAVTDADGRTSVYGYRNDPAHYLETVMDPQGRMPRRYEYDPTDGRLLAVIDENGNRREALYDPQGFAGMTVDGRGNVTLIEYDQRGNLTRQTDPLGHSIEYRYDDPANPDRETELIDAAGQSWTYSYNAMGLPVELRTPLAAGNNQNYEIDYDAQGNMLRFEGLSNLENSYSFDAAGNRLSEQIGGGRRFDFVYGPGGQLLQRQYSDEFAVSYGYDSRGYLASQSDPFGYQLALQARPNGRLQQRSDNLGMLQVDYAPGGLLRSQIDDNGAQAQLVENADGSWSRTDRNGHVTLIERDTEGRQRRLQLPGGASIESDYDADGRPASLRDPLGHQTDFDYDAAGRLQRISDPLGATDAYQRDVHGNPTEIIDRNGRRRSFEWDANRRLRFERWFDGGGTQVREIEFIYDPARGLARVDDRYGGQTYTIEYNGRLPRPTRVSYTLPGQQPWHLIYVWDDQAEHAREARIERGSTRQSRLVVEEIGGLVQRIEWAHPQSSTIDNEVQLLRRPDGQVGEWRRFTGNADGGAQAISRFAYDNLGRVTQIRHEDAAGLLLHPNAELNYSWDNERRMLGETHAGNSVGFGYDVNGQLTVANHSDAGFADENYQYDVAGNRLSSHLAPTPATLVVPNRLTASGDHGYLYDAAGNLTRRTQVSTGVVTEFGYDHRNRLISASVHPSLGAPATTTFAFGYDYLDRLLWRDLDGARTWFIHDGDHLAGEFADGASSLNAAYLYDPAELDRLHAIWRDDGLGERWLLTDPLGSVRGITDRLFLTQSWVDYDAFGNRQPGPAPAADEAVAWAGRPFLPQLGLYDNRRRLYDPQLGRFIQEDPTRFGGRDHHLYRYALNNPLFFRDPTGETPGVNYFQLYEEFVLGIFLVNDGIDGLKAPCHIASWSAGNFGYFQPLADLILDPVNESGGPALEPVNLLEQTGCGSK